MSFLKSKGFKYLKNLIIGVGAAFVMLGALFKIESLPNASLFLTIGLCTEAFIFLFLGLIGPDADYYWEKLYPGLNKYGGSLEHLRPDSGQLDISTEKMEGQLDGVLTEMRTMAQSLSSLKALQEVDFTSTGDDIKKMGTFYSSLNEAMANINDSVDDTRRYKEQLGQLTTNLDSLNGVYGNQIEKLSDFYNHWNEAMANFNDSVDDTRAYRENLASLNQNLGSLNSVYGNILSTLSNPLGK